MTVRGARAYGVLAHEESRHHGGLADDEEVYSFCGKDGWMWDREGPRGVSWLALRKRANVAVLWKRRSVDYLA
jgi:hypothetical protein